MIVLYGALRKKFGKTINCKVNSLAELMKAAEANRPGFRNSIKVDSDYVIRRGDTFKDGKDVTEAEAEMLFSEDTWHVLPLAVGHKGGIFQTIIGAVLTVVGVYFEQGWLVNIGVGMMLGGVANMLAPAPTVANYSDRNDPDERPSYLFNGPVNRTQPGCAVPLIYGKDVWVGSVFVSGGLEIGDMA